MKTPFTTDQFFLIFEKYNLTVFPFQLSFLILAITCLFLLHSRSSQKNRFIGIFLSFLWIWTGLVYHMIFFTEINKVAYLFGGIFILQGILILINTFIKNKLVFSFSPGARDYTGYFLILFSLIIYPFIGYLSEGSFDKIISLGLPCPSTIFTFGFLLLAKNRFPKYLLIIPSLWAVVGLSAAINFGVYQDFMILVAAITVNIFLIRNGKNNKG